MSLITRPMPLYILIISFYKLYQYPTIQVVRTMGFHRLIIFRLLAVTDEKTTFFCFGITALRKTSDKSAMYGAKFKLMVRLDGSKAPYDSRQYFFVLLAITKT